MSYQEDGSPLGCHISEFVETGEEWDEYLERMSKNKEWGSHIELTALTDAVGVPILVTTDSMDEEQYQVWIYPKDVHTDEVVLLGYSYASSHYYSLEGKLS